MNSSAVYESYWQRKALLRAGPPDFSVRHWWPTEELCAVERLWFEAVRGAPSLLDVGAGDLKYRGKLRRAGWRGEYHSQDIGGEYAHTYRSLDEVRRSYAAILCMDVLEHLTLEAGVSLIQRMAEILDDGGVLVIQTPNARCIRHPLSWDMTHLQCYNAPDLWAFLTSIGLRTEGYRVVFTTAGRRPWRRVQELLGAFLITRLTGCDYADNLLLIARKGG